MVRYGKILENPWMRRYIIPAVPAAGTLVAAEALGFTDYMVNYSVYQISYFGQWERDLSEFIRPVSHVGWDTLSFLFGGSVARLVLEMVYERL